MTGSDNLTPYVKGESGNPNGRPKGSRNRSTIIREILDAAAAESLKSKNGLDLGVQPKTIFDQMVLAQVVKAVAVGDTAAFKELADGAFGKVTDKLQQTVQYKKMGRVIAEPVVDPAKPDSAPKAFELTFDVGEDPANTTEEEEIEDDG